MDFSGTEETSIFSRVLPCCKKGKVPEFCLGLCTEASADARSLQGKRLNACSQYERIIATCWNLELA